MFEGFVDERPVAALAGAVPGPELAEGLIDAGLVAPSPDPADHSPDGDAAWQAGTGEALDRVAGWARMTAWTQAQEMLAVESLVSRTVERAQRRPPGTLLDEHVGGVGAEVDSVMAELALTWRVAQRTAARRVDEAVSLVGGLPLLVDAMLDGRLGLAHVRSVAGVLLGLTPELRERICRDLLAGTATGQQIARTPAQLAACARRAAVRLDPTSARRRERAATRERGVHLGAEDHGMATVTAYLPAAEALLLYRTIDAHARGAAPGDEEDRSPDARRADALTDLVALGAVAAAGGLPEPDLTAEDSSQGGGRTHDEPAAESDTEPTPCTCPPAPPAATDPTGAPVPAPRRPGDDGGPDASTPVTDPDTSASADPETPAPAGASPPSGPPPGTGRGPAPRGAPVRLPRNVQIRVVVSADTLLGLDERPAELGGYGPITAQAARALAAEADATWRRILTDPASGAVLDVGHRRYRPPAAMAEHVRNRDLNCRFPGCRVPAQACDLDHVVRFDPHDPDGRTAADNLDPDCRHHHRIKHLPGWAVARGPDGSLLWTTPSGRRYRTVRPVLLPAAGELPTPEHPPGHPPDRRDLAAMVRPGPDADPTAIDLKPASPTVLIRGDGDGPRH